VLNPSAPIGKSMKYARRELERRFLLTEVPPTPGVIRTAVITDRYIAGTRFRLRRSIERSAESTATVYKLTQKIPADDGGPGLITTMYLSEAEFDAFSKLPGDVLTKTRLSIPPFGIDVFDPPLDGLILAEAEFETEEEMLAFGAPRFAVADVTADPRFTGGRLVRCTREELRAALADVRS